MRNIHVLLQVTLQSNMVIFEKNLSRCKQFLQLCTKRCKIGACR